MFTAYHPQERPQGSVGVSAVWTSCTAAQTAWTALLSYWIQFGRIRGFPTKQVCFPLEDEAHQIFQDAPKKCKQYIEMVGRFITERSSY